MFLQGLHTTIQQDHKESLHLLTLEQYHQPKKQTSIEAFSRGTDNTLHLLLINTLAINSRVGTHRHVTAFQTIHCVP